MHLQYWLNLVNIVFCCWNCCSYHINSSTRIVVWIQFDSICGLVSLPRSWLIDYGNSFALTDDQDHATLWLVNHNRNYVLIKPHSISTSSSRKQCTHTIVVDARLLCWVAQRSRKSRRLWNVNRFVTISICSIGFRNGNGFNVRRHSKCWTRLHCLKHFSSIANPWQFIQSICDIGFCREWAPMSRSLFNKF